jgi:hypothetical protein
LRKKRELLRKTRNEYEWGWQNAHLKEYEKCGEINMCYFAFFANLN